MVVSQVWNVPRARSNAARLPYTLRKTSWVRSSASEDDPVNRKHKPYTRLWCAFTSSVHAKLSPLMQRSTRTCHSSSTGFSRIRSCSLRCHRSAGLRSSFPGARYCPRNGPGARTPVREAGRAAGNPNIPRFHESVPALMGNHTQGKAFWFRKTDPQPPHNLRIAISRFHAYIGSHPPRRSALTRRHGPALILALLCAASSLAQSQPAPAVSQNNGTQITLGRSVVSL